MRTFRSKIRNKLADRNVVRSREGRGGNGCARGQKRIVSRIFESEAASSRVTGIYFKKA